MMTQLLTLDRAVPAAVHIARAEVRARNNGGDVQAVHHRLCDLFERVAQPGIAMELMVRSIGRTNALAIEIDPDVVERAIRHPRFVEDKASGRVFAK